MTWILKNGTHTLGCSDFCYCVLPWQGRGVYQTSPKIHQYDTRKGDRMSNQRTNSKDFLSVLLRIVAGKRMTCLRQLSKRKQQQKTGRNRYNIKMKKISEEGLYVFLYFLNDYVWTNVLTKHDVLPFLKQQS